MEWPDLVLTLAGWALNLSALTTLMNKRAAVPMTHSGIVLVSMVAIVVAYVGLGLWSSVVATVVGIGIWAGIAVYRRPEPRSQSIQPEPYPNDD
jgi:O-antigen/teichoic acid export membrane protein